MKRLVFAIFLVVACDAAAAKRQLLDDTDEFVAYAEAESIERTDGTAKMWVLYDYKEKHTYLKWAYWSQRTLNELQEAQAVQRPDAHEDPPDDARALDGPV